MTYNVNTPLSTDPLRQFPGDVSTNQWPRLRTIIDADHNFSNSASATQGYHKVIHFVDQGTTDPAAVPGVGQLYTKTPAAYTNPDQFAFYQSGDGSVIQMNGTYQAATSGWATLPGGLILIWGNMTPSSSLTVNFPNIGYATAGFPNNAFQVQMTVLANPGPTLAVPRYHTLTQTGFEVLSSTTAGYQISYLAIGN